MSRSVLRLTCVSWLMLGLAVTGCPSAETGSDEPSADSTPMTSATAPQGTVAIVNGQPIFVEDLDLAMGRIGHDKEHTPQRRERVLDSLIEDELLAQRAGELGLDDDPVVQRTLRPAHVRFEAARRAALGEALFRHEIEAKATVDEAAIAAYYDEHREQIEAEVRVWQILRKDRASIEQVAAALEAGTPFEEVAAASFPPEVVKHSSPWDLGYINWSQIPEPWAEVLPTLEAGQVSGIIEGPAERYWIIQLVERRHTDEVTLETAGPLIDKLLVQQAIDQRRDELRQQLRSGATIDYLEPPPPVIEE